MQHSRFIPSFGELPSSIPVFPLESVIVLPGAELPLNIFEPRYLNMVEDALKTHHMFGMVQPKPIERNSSERLYPTGCVGRITAYSETDDERILLSLKGLIRFRIKQELPSVRGYRVVIPDWEPFANDLKQEKGKVLRDRPMFTQRLRHFLREKSLEVDWRALGQMTDVQLVHTMATLLPLESAEKQAILEAPSAYERASVLLTALEISTIEGSPLRH
jgi:Lon protease-like protein